MIPNHHILFSTMFFGLAYLLGFEPSYIVIGFLASILIDLDHFFVGSIAGGYNPKTIYDFCLNPTVFGGMTLDKALKAKIFGTRLLPFHNIWACSGFGLLWPPVGIGMSLHLALDLISLPFMHPKTTM